MSVKARWYARMTVPWVIYSDSPVDTLATRSFIASKGRNEKLVNTVQSLLFVALVVSFARAQQW